MERTTTFCVWFSLVIFLGISVDGVLSQGQQHLKKTTHSSAVVVGTVYCDTCFNGAFSKSPRHLIPGALVGVECIDENSKPSFRQEVKTDERGEFKVKLPFSVSKHVKKIKRCSVKLLRSSQPFCSIAASSTSTSFKRLKSSKHGENTRVFSAGFFTFKPENQPEICSQKPINLRESKPLLPDPAFPPPIQDPVPNPASPLPNLPIVPPLPDLPLPQLPPLLPPRPQQSDTLHTKKSDSLKDKKAEVVKPNFFFPPNPLNPPSVIPPNPLIPSIPTPSLPPNPLIPSPPTLPPLPLQPPPAPVLPPIPTLPPVPTLPLPPVPTLPLPPVPTLPLPPVPTLPLPPVPGVNPPKPPPPSFLPIPFPPLIPGVPPASSSFSTHHQP